MKDLGSSIEHINSAINPEEAFNRFCSIMSNYGYERVAYSLITDHPSLSLPKQHGLATSYPAHWMKHYNENKYLARDPVVIGILKSRVPFFWDDLRKDKDIPESSLKILDQGSESGVKDGIAIPLFGVTGEVVGLGLARKEGEKGRDYDLLASVHLLSTYFHEKYRSLITNPVVSKITIRERDILSWATEGKTDEEIAQILNISANTVRWHWKKIFVKLETHGRLYSITKAIMTGLVTPNYIAPH